MENQNMPIIVEQSYTSSIKEVWSAITNLVQMKQWFFENIQAFEPRVGFKTQFNVVSGERKFMHLWEIIGVIPQKKIVYSWKYKEYLGAAKVTFELFEKNNKTTLRITNEGLETFPVDIPEFTRESCTQGWEYFIQNRLKEFLNNIA